MIKEKYMITKTITLSILALAIFSHVYGAKYTVINSGSDPITVKIDLWKVEHNANDPVSTPLTADNLKPKAGKTKLSRIGLSGSNTRNGEFESNVGVKGDRTIEFTSVSGQWFISVREN